MEVNSCLSGKAEECFRMHPRFLAGFDALGQWSYGHIIWPVGHEPIKLCHACLKLCPRLQACQMP